MKRLLSLFVILVLICGIVMADGKISSDLQKKLSTARADEQIPVLVVFEGLPSFEEVAREYRFLGEEELIREQVIRVLKEKVESIQYWLRQLLESRPMSDQVSQVRPIWIVNAISLNATPAVIAEIVNQPNVGNILLDEPVPMLVETRDIAWGVTKINADKAWASNYNGFGVTVAVIDTGVNEHGDLKGRLVDGKNYITPTAAPRDDHGHGTHCSGTVAGDGACGTQTGVAPKATIKAIKVLSASGSGSWGNLVSAIEEVMESRDVKVISMSLGGNADATTQGLLQKACNNVIEKGIIPVIAAGNSGPSASTVGAPGNVQEVITIGATDSSDVIASFSSRGPVKGTNIIKPDVSAPGVTVNSCRHDNNGYRTMSGTSMATPHVAGVVALMVQAKPGLICADAKTALEATSVDLGTAGKDNTYGAGRVDALKAVQAVKSLARTADRSGDRFEMVVKELTFNAYVDGNGNINISQAIENDLMPATVTIWADVKETEGRKGYYYVNFTLKGPNGEKTGTARVDYDNIPTDPNKYDAKYGFNCGNFDLVKGTYTGTVASIESNPKVKNLNITLVGKATWPARQ